MEYLILIIIGIVIYLSLSRKSRINSKKSKHEKSHFQFQRNIESKVNDVTIDVRVSSTQMAISHSPNVACCAYLDIETTSLKAADGDLTVIGLYLEDGNEHKIIQLVENKISSSKLIEVMKKVKVLYTYNGTQFDLPYIKAKLGVDLTKYCIHKDLMYICWQRNLYGGLKEVERKLGIKRKLTNIDGKTAVQLWRNYKFYKDRDSLITLLEYNKEDVSNLRILRKKLNV
jgi:hypothetical protein